MSAATLHAAGQALLAVNHPATITIDEQDYAASTSGLERTSAPDEGRHRTQKRTTFRLPIQAFVTAGKTIPGEGDPLTCSAPANVAGNYHIDSTRVDAVNINLTLVCSELPQ